jgi:hypothetical protein
MMNLSGMPTAEEGNGATGDVVSDQAKDTIEDNAEQG